MRNAAKAPEAWRGMPSMPAELKPPLAVIGKAVTASEAEVAANVRARSARLRVAERV
jgi:16S rRNA (cytosine1402-N4)-methyltransferase